MSTVPPQPARAEQSRGLPEEGDAGAARGVHGTTEGEDSAALLAELDALLERMLALPVHQGEEPSGLPTYRTEVPPEGMELITVTQAMPEPQERPPERPRADPPAPKPPVDDLYFQTLLADRSAGTRPPEPVSVRREERAPDSGPARPPAPVVPAEPAAPYEDPLPLPLVPLWWCTRAFDGLVAPLGPLARALRTPSGRALLGWAGLVMLAVVVGLAVHDYLDWTR